jgi:hypothetical protein
MISQHTPPNTDKLLAQGVGTMDILHGHLKSLIHEAQGDGEYGEPSDPYARGVFDTLCEMYRLTYAIIFAEMDRGCNSAETVL